ncbi:MAG: TonB-dependent receptor [Gemmatimonadales bacterium]|nr:TonB-dependent receptor [Gemmatimonadales bacterium]
MRTRPASSLRLLLRLVAAAAIAGTAPEPLAAQLPGSITGALTDRETSAALADARVTLQGTERVATTDAAGRFTLPGVPRGNHVLRITAIGYVPRLVNDVVVQPGRPTAITVTMERAVVELQELTVAPSLFERRPEVPTSTVTVGYEEIRRSPGAIGDVTRLVQAMPGVILSNDQRNDIVARGGSPMENLILVDNIEVPNLSHFAAQNTSGGPISMLNTELIGATTFSAGGFGAQYGNRASAVLDVTLREGDRTRWLSEADVSFAGAGLVVEGPVGRRGSAIVSVRQSFLDLVAGSFGLTAIPNYTNLQAKLAFDLSPRDRLWLVSLGGRDNINFTVDPADLDDPSLENTNARGWRVVNGINWQRRFGGAVGTLTLSDAYSRFATDVTDAQLGNALTFRNRSGEGESTLRYDLAARPAARLGVKAGVSLKRFRSRLELAQPFGAQDPLSTDPARVNAVSIDQSLDGWLVGSYAMATATLGRWADVTLGARADRFDMVGATRLAPRGSLSLHLTPTLDLNASAGRYYQQVPLVYLGADPQNRMLAPLRADHLVAGLAWQARPDLRVSVEGFLKEYADYPVATQYPTVSLANTGDVYGVGGLLFPLASQGTGRSRGVELFVQQKLTSRLYGQLSGTFSRTEHRALDGVLRRGAFDVPVMLTGIVGYRAGDSWEFSARYTYATGRPLTPVLTSLATVQNRLILDVARTNAERAPDYARLDVRVDRRFRLFGTNQTVYVEVQNVLDRENVFQQVWNGKTRALDALNQIRFFPVFGYNVQL